MIASIKKSLGKIINLNLKLNGKVDKILVGQKSLEERIQKIEEKLIDDEESKIYDENFLIVINRYLIITITHILIKSCTKLTIILYRASSKVSLRVCFANRYTQHKRIFIMRRRIFSSRSTNPLLITLIKISGVRFMKKIFTNV